MPKTAKLNITGKPNPKGRPKGSKEPIETKLKKVIRNKQPANEEDYIEDVLYEPQEEPIGNEILLEEQVNHEDMQKFIKQRIAEEIALLKAEEQKQLEQRNKDKELRKLEKEKRKADENRRQLEEMRKLLKEQESTLNNRYVQNITSIRRNNLSY